MIIGVGTDVCSISRVERAVASPRFLKRIFTEEEMEYAQKKARPAASLAVAFAAREAFCKASGISMYDVAFGREVSVIRDESGRPSLVISQKIRTQIGRDFNAFLSVSHESDFAVAFVVLEKNK